MMVSSEKPEKVINSLGDSLVHEKKERMKKSIMGDLELRGKYNIIYNSNPRWRVAKALFGKIRP